MIFSRAEFRKRHKYFAEALPSLCSLLNHYLICLSYSSLPLTHSSSPSPTFFRSSVSHDNLSPFSARPWISLLLHHLLSHANSPPLISHCSPVAPFSISYCSLSSLPLVSTPSSLDRNAAAAAPFFFPLGSSLLSLIIPLY